MNTWKALYMKEIKENRTLFILLVLVTAFLELVAVLSFGGAPGASPVHWSASAEPGGVTMSVDHAGGGLSFHFLWSLVPFSFMLILPFLLVHSFAQEVKGQTHYLLLSLPVSRAQVFAAKAAAVTTLGLVLFALSTAGLVAVFGELRALAAQAGMRSIPFTAMHVSVFTGACYLSAMALMLGMAGGVAGLKLVVRRFAGLASAAFVLGVLYCYFSTLPDIFHWIDLPGKHEMSFWTDPDGDVQVSMNPEFLKINLTFFAHSLFVGLASMGIGMWLFEKRAEA